MISQDGQPLLEVKEHVSSFRHARAARRSALAADYVELIADLIAAGGEARQVDVAARLGVAQPTVAKMLKRLADEGLVMLRPYRGIFLTGAGEDRKSTRLNSSHANISYAVFCLKKKKNTSER